MTKKILEIGCGQGFNTYNLSKKNNSIVVGVDLSSEDIAIAKKRYPNVDFRVMNSEKLEFEENYFDEVHAMDILEHVDNLPSVINEVTRVLKKDGKFIIKVPYHKSEEWLLKIRPTYFKEIHHVRIFQETELETILNNTYTLSTKRRIGFLVHIELYFLFKRNIGSKSQLGIGNWRDTFWTKLLHVSVLYFDPIILKTPLVYLPLWIITIPFGWLINSIGNIYFPKTLYYEFIKK